MINLQEVWINRLKSQNLYLPVSVSSVAFCHFSVQKYDFLSNATGRIIIGPFLI